MELVVVVDVNVSTLSSLIVSPSTNLFVTPIVDAPTEPVALTVFVADAIYFTYNVGESVVVAPSNPITLAVTPEVAPVIIPST